ncbi:MAG: recombinase RecA [Candidatus Nealsonbacteria bacterium RIFOXYB1_FULL_40_15]|uniref:Protein RecA n=2 Tax=Candidatus Nealsoniibacteriota TaxID=1817911 RepID=A0A1G2EU51_9BACT|nr:MAG: recombinase RecA [Candidatus Nealsonbacteria bacterium RIFOXYB1_FULL_40_15]OGZ28880.1 MAG: recombinase RecA [Candidatus Nealsonbacteria bacterium RIFOXYC1_FULL_40_7]OGZ29133.1 MAG: recombinase RecA [Candidatus Nealsonbacteria bacterium RIFOXYD1_FULL_39_11]
MNKKEETKNSRENLQEALEEIKQRFGEGAIMNLGDAKAMDVESISTGSISLDQILGVGGFPRGRVIEVFGPESSGKTTIALHLCSQTQKMGGVAAFIDAEHALDPDYAKRIGVNISELLISQPDSGEQALQIVETLVSSGEVDVIVVDSVAALTPKAEIAGEIGDFQIGLQARLMSSALRKLAGIVSKTKTIVLFLNQTRMKIGVLFGNPETTPGGMALKFYSSVRLEVRRAAQIKQGEIIVGNRVRAKVIKNKVAPPFKTTEFDIYYNEGISYAADLLNTGIRQEVIKKSGSWFQFGETKLGQGMEGAKNYLKENPKVITEIKKAILEQS